MVHYVFSYMYRTTPHSYLHLSRSYSPLSFSATIIPYIGSFLVFSCSNSIACLGHVGVELIGITSCFQEECLIFSPSKA